LPITVGEIKSIFTPPLYEEFVGDTPMSIGELYSSFILFALFFKAICEYESLEAMVSGKASFSRHSTRGLIA
jgi:hypothetical protein